MTNLPNLIERLEAAEAPSRELFLAAWSVVWPDILDGYNLPFPEAKKDRFTTMLDAEAWTSAAEMLVPVGMDFASGTGRAQHITENGRKPWAWCAQSDGFQFVEHLPLAAHQANALCIAALRAQEADRG